MTDNKTHSVLFELQKNLEDLSSAKTQMEEFRISSVKVVQAINNVQAKYVEHLESIKTDYETRVNELKKESTSFLSENQKENKNVIQKIVSTSEETISKGISKFETVANAIEKSNNEKIEVINNLLEHYKNVVEASKSLIETLKKIDFPTKLDALSSKSQLIIESITSAKQALEIKSNKIQNFIIDKTITIKDQIIQNNDDKYNSLSEKLNENRNNLTKTFTDNANEQLKQLKTNFDNLNEISERRFDLTKQRLDKQDKEIKSLKIILFIVVGLITVGIILNLILKHNI
ncbi:hypothetical protein EZS27_016599 [termite gut metagenome]|uniref:Uncharacterized protein n=1 Tax=termite gut metagenome TaxID=433724 RepID=A0A5J4RPW7_9ZZZZ